MSRFLHAIRNWISVAYGFSTISLSTDEDIISLNINPSTTLKEIINNYDEFQFIIESSIQKCQQLPDLIHHWIDLANHTQTEIEWTSLVDVLQNILNRGVPVKIHNPELLETIQFPQGVLECIINELETNSTQIAALRSAEAQVQVDVDIKEENEIMILVITFQDRAGGFEDINIELGKTTREGGTGTGLTVVHSQAQALGGKVSRENWSMKENNEKPVGARFSLKFPLQSVQVEAETEKAQVETEETQADLVPESILS